MMFKFGSRNYEFGMTSPYAIDYGEGVGGNSELRTPNSEFEDGLDGSN
jgi:hypothetical protein